MLIPHAGRTAENRLFIALDFFLKKPYDFIKADGGRQ